MADSKDDTKNDKTQNSSNLRAEPLSRIKSSVLSRGLAMTKLALQAGASLAGQSVTTALSTQEEKDEKWKGFIKSQAHIITKELGELKGSLMKAGQMLSMYGEHFLPPEANEVLKALQSNSPPLKWEVIDTYLKKYLSPEKLAELEIEQTALASASMGQVHRAKIKKTGELICLKIQYPDVDKAIDSDLKAIRALLNMLKLLPRDVNLDPVFNEIRSMLIQETNYELEAELTQKFYKLLEGDSRFVVPKVYPDFSNKKILATSFERGLRVDDPLIQNLSQDRRNKLAINFLDLYFKELFDWKIMQTDPHNGNYKVRIDPSGNDQLVLLDFGATRSFEDSFILPYHRMIRGAFLDEDTEFKRAAQELKLLHESDNIELQRLFCEFCYESVEPFKTQNTPDGVYDWKNTDLPQRLSKKIFQVVKEHAWRTPPQELLFLDRKTGGVFIFLSVLRAKINAGPLMRKYVDKVPKIS